MRTRDPSEHDSLNIRLGAREIQAAALLSDLEQVKSAIKSYSGISVVVLAQYGFDALAELVQLFLQDLVLGVVGFGSDVAS
jgi:hypothetical protein